MWKISKLSEEEKDIKRKKVRDRYKSISEKKKYVSIWKNIIWHIKKLLGLSKDLRAIRLVSRIIPWSVEEIIKVFYGFKDLLL